MSETGNCDALACVRAAEDYLEALRQEGPFIAVDRVEQLVRAAFHEGWMAHHELRAPDENDVANDWVVSKARKTLTALLD
tara:strand:- start:112 stop:351 length:240 start_codon:yes stop_codon:yes gene_type:complete